MSQQITVEGRVDCTHKWVRTPLNSKGTYNRYTCTACGRVEVIDSSD